MNVIKETIDKVYYHNEVLKNAANNANMFVNCCNVIGTIQEQSSIQKSAIDFYIANIETAVKEIGNDVVDYDLEQFEDDLIKLLNYDSSLNEFDYKNLLSFCTKKRVEYLRKYMDDVEFVSGKYEEYRKLRNSNKYGNDDQAYIRAFLGSILSEENKINYPYYVAEYLYRFLLSFKIMNQDGDKICNGIIEYLRKLLGDVDNSIIEYIDYRVLNNSVNSLSDSINHSFKKMINSKELFGCDINEQYVASEIKFNTAIGEDNNCISEIMESNYDLMDEELEVDLLLPELCEDSEHTLIKTITPWRYLSLTGKFTVK